MGNQSVHDLVFVLDDAGRMRNAGLISAMQARCLSVSELTAELVEDSALLAVDVDLTLLENVRRLRTALRGRRDRHLHLFAVDLSRRLETVHAHIIGATDLMRRPFDGHEIHSKILAFTRAQHEPASVIDVSVVRAAGAIGDMFSALTAGATLEMPSVAEAGTEIIDAIDSVGFPSWLDAVRQHHEGTFQHCVIVTGLASTFGRATGMSSRDVLTLTTVGLLHDIGKAAVPVAILDKPGKLTDEEMAIVKTHPARGYDYLLGQKDIRPDVLAAVRGHHEYLDGSGYPDGLEAVRIGDLTRILTICDVYGAMIEARAYKPPMPAGKALAVLDDMVMAGKLERPLVRAFRQAVAV